MALRLCVLPTTHVIGCSPSLKCLIGSGLFIFDSLHGSQRDFTGDVEHTLYGAGALHVRIEVGTTAGGVGFYRMADMLIHIYAAGGSFGYSGLKLAGT